MQKIIIGVIVLAAIAVGAFWYLQNRDTSTVVENTTDTNQPIATTTPETATTEPKVTESIGTSAGGSEITAYNFGSGDKKILFVGGIHGGYEWNTSLVALQLIDYLKANPSAVPTGVRLTVIPVVNPDGLIKVTGTSTRFTAADVNASQSVQVSGRFNANTVDLNRNFDCDWQAKGVWQNKQVSGGTAAFSEPESAAMKSYIEAIKPTAVVIWYSSAGGVYASNCHGGVSTETATLMKLYADASKYPAHESWDFYATTGDMANWLAKINVPAISVLLTNHTDTEWDKNLAGIKAILQHYVQ